MVHNPVLELCKKKILKLSEIDHKIRNIFLSWNYMKIRILS